MTDFARLRPTLCLCLAAMTGACALPSEDSGGADGGPHEELRAQIVRSIAYEAVAPSFAAVESEAAALVTATEAYAAATGEAARHSARDEARAAWRSAMQAWQRVEMMQLGPVGSSSKAIGGADRRDEVYSWPSINSCRVDQELVLGEYANDDFISSRLVNTYGLDALEYLLFNEEMTNTCAPQLDINAKGEWEALGDTEVDSRRGAYAAALARAFATEVASLSAAWSADDGEWTVHLADPRAADSPYESLPKALDEILRVMFYLDTTVKDVKVGVPAGILNCSAAPCISELESTWAQASKEAVVANLEGFALLYHGGPNPETDHGFDDLIVAFGDEALAAKMTGDIETAIATCGSVEGSFAAALQAEATALDACHASIREITDSLKGDFATLLMLTIPSEAAGDAD